MRILFKMNKVNQQRQLEKLVDVYPALYSMQATYLRNEGNDVVWDGEDDGSFDIVYTDDMQPKIDFLKLPYPDRIFTNAKNKIYQSYGNYIRKPASHILSSNLCWWSRCVFCQDTKRINEGEARGVRSVDHVLEEIDNCIELGFRELFDDAGTIPHKGWLEEFCNKMISSGRNKRIMMGCNSIVMKMPWKLMKEAGFRFILLGVESANQETLDKINKVQDASKIIEVMKAGSKAGLDMHGTFMTGYPWEGEKDEKRTIDLCHYLLRKGYLKTAQASVYSEPRTLPSKDSKGHTYLPRFYDIYKNPEFIFRKISSLKRWEDFTYLVRGARLVVEEKVRKLCR